MVVEKEHSGVHSPKSRISGDNFPSPLGIQQVPISLELPRVHKLSIVSDLDAAATSDEGEDILPFRVHVSVLALPPFGLIENFGQDQERFDSAEDFARVEGCIGGAFAAEEDVRQIFPRSPFGDNSRPELRAPSGDHGRLNLRVNFLKTSSILLCDTTPPV